MIKLINLVHSAPLVNHEKVDYVNYIQVNENEAAQYVKDIIVGMPVFFVGYNLTKTIFKPVGYSVDVLNKDIATWVSWEFSYEENRSSHIEGVFDVVSRRVLDIRFSGTEYELIDPIFSNIRQEDEIYPLINPVDYAYVYKEMCYLYNSVKNRIYGIDLNTYDFFGFSKSNILELITSRSKKDNIDPAGDVFVEYKLKFPFANHLKRYLVLLLQNSIE